MTRRGQALVELAVTLPVLMILAFGGVEFVRLGIARAGLDAATAGAVAAAARAPDATTAASAATAAFAGVAQGFRLDSPTLSVRVGTFRRGATISATGFSDLDLGFSGVRALRLHWHLRSTASARVEDWRSRSAVP
jgi:Flp pilus assembly protein TadG